MFFRCKQCGNLVGKIYESGVEMVCCGEKMEKLTANTVDASKEKHVPDVKIVGNKVMVNVGAINHPMEEKHYIMWIYLETKNGGQRKTLKPGDKPYAEFMLIEDELIAVYEYCNLHGLWKYEVK